MHNVLVLHFNVPCNSFSVIIIQHACHLVVGTEEQNGILDNIFEFLQLMMWFSQDLSHGVTVVVM
jgi:hypothetical protein